MTSSRELYIILLPPAESARASDREFVALVSKKFYADDNRATLQVKNDNHKLTTKVERK